MLIFIFLNFYLFWCFLFLPALCPCFHLDSFFSFCLRIPFINAGLLVISTLNFLSEKSFISSSFLKDIFTVYECLDWQLFFVRTLKVVFHYSLASTFFYWKLNCQSYFYSFEGKVSFFFWLLSRFFLSLCFSSLLL